MEIGAPVFRRACRHALCQPALEELRAPELAFSPIATATVFSPAPELEANIKLPKHKKRSRHTRAISGIPLSFLMRQSLPELGQGNFKKNNIQVDF